MFENPEFRALKNKIQRRVGIDEQSAVIGDGNGTVHVAQRSNYVWVRINEGDRYSQITPARMDASINVFDGAACIVATVGGELTVIRGLADEQLAQGAILTGSVNMNPMDKTVRRALFTGTLEAELLVDPTDPPSQSVLFAGAVFVNNGILHSVEPDEIDLSSYYPSAGTRNLAVLFLDSSDEIEVQTGSEFDPSFPPASFEIQEAIDSASAGAKPIYALNLVDGDNEISEFIEGGTGSQLWQDLRSTHNDNDIIGGGVTKTIATGVVAAAGDRNLIIAAESGTADDLDEITGLDIGNRVYLRADTGDTITVKHNAGAATVKIHLIGDTDTVLDEQNAIEFVLIATNVLVQTGNVAMAQISPLTTKGDLFVYGTADTRLAVGTNDQVLVADSAEATGLKWGAIPAMETIIAPTTLSVAASNIQLGTVTTDPLPTDYTQFLIAMYVRGSVSSLSARVRFNNDTGGNYAYFGYRIDDTGAVTVVTPHTTTYTNLLNQGIMGTVATTSAFSWLYIWISGHENTNAFTTARGESWYEASTTLAYKVHSQGYWQSTAVVEEIDIYPTSGNFIADSVYALYGIK